jgi:hypothetical protein
VINEDTPRDDAWWNASLAHCTFLQLPLSHDQDRGFYRVMFTT